MVEELSILPLPSMYPDGTSNDIPYSNRTFRLHCLRRRMRQFRRMVSWAVLAALFLFFLVLLARSLLRQGALLRMIMLFGLIAGCLFWAGFILYRFARPPFLRLIGQLLPLRLAIPPLSQGQEFSFTLPAGTVWRLVYVDEERVVITYYRKGRQTRREWRRRVWEIAGGTGPGAITLPHDAPCTSVAGKTERFWELRVRPGRWLEKEFPLLVR